MTRFGVHEDKCLTVWVTSGDSVSKVLYCALNAIAWTGLLLEESHFTIVTINIIVCWFSKHQIIDSFGFSAVVRHRDCPALDTLEALPDCAPRLGTCLPTALI